MPNVCTTKQLCDLFEIDRRTLNRRINKLKTKNIHILTISDSGMVKYPEESVAILEKAHQHLQIPGATLNTFVLESKTEVAPVETSNVETLELTSLTDEKIYLIVSAIGQALSHAVSQPKVLSPYEKKLELRNIARQGFLLTSKEVCYYTGKQPVSCRTDLTTGDRYYPYGNFRFYKCDRVGNDSFWRIVFTK